VTQELALVYLPDFGGVLHYGAQKQFDVTAGDAFLRLPGKLHRFVANGPGWQLYLAMPEETFPLLRRFYPELGKNPVLQPGGDKDLLDDFVRTARNLRDAEREELHRHYLDMQRLFVSVLRRSARPSQDSRTAAVVQRVHQRLAKHPESRVPLSEIAEEEGINYHLLRKRFHEYYGIGLGEYRISRRIESAAYALMEGDRSVGETAAELGYSDIYSFSKQFKKYTGQSPSRFAAR
jgi:AraC-like DNA-binding protein